MKRAASIALLVALFVPAASQAQPSADDATILQIERRWQDALVSGDISYLQNFLAEDFINTSYKGVLFTKEDILAGMGSGSQAQGVKQVLSDETVQYAGNDVVLIRGLNTISKGSQVVLRLRFTDVLRRRGTSWQAISAQETIVTSP